MAYLSVISKKNISAVLWLITALSSISFLFFLYGCGHTIFDDIMSRGGLVGYLFIHVMWVAGIISLFMPPVSIKTTFGRIIWYITGLASSTFGGPFLFMWFAEPLHIVRPLWVVIVIAGFISLGMFIQTFFVKCRVCSMCPCVCNANVQK